jgi:protein O-GlcNAc transferase
MEYKMNNVYKSAIIGILKNIFKYYKNILNFLVFNRNFDKHCFKWNQKIKIFQQNISNISNRRLKNVLHINTFDKIGGAAILANSLCKELNGRGLDSKLLVHKKFFNDNYTFLLKRIRSIKQLLFDFLQIRNNWDDFYESSSIKIFELELFKNADIIHLHNIHGGYFNPLLLPVLTSIKPVIWTFHDTQELKYPCDNYKTCEKWQNDCYDCDYYDKKYFEDKMFKLWLKKKNIFESSNFTIVCPSNWLKSKVQNSVFRNHNIELVYNGIDTLIYTNKRDLVNRTDFGLPDDKFIILFIAHGGINNPSKGGEYFHKVYDCLKSNEFFFISIGGNKTGFKDKNWMEIDYIDDQIKMASYYSLSDLLVYPSVNDVFGLVVAESLACGTPVVTFRTGGIPEIVEHMKTGYIAPQGDIDKIIDGVMIYYNNVELRKRVEIDGPLRVKQKFSVDVMVDNYIRLYEKKIKEFNILN